MIVVRRCTLGSDGDRGVCTMRRHDLARSGNDASGVVELNGPGIDFAGPACGTDPIQTLLTMIHFAYLQIHLFESSRRRVLWNDTHHRTAYRRSFTGLLPANRAIHIEG